MELNQKTAHDWAVRSFGQEHVGDARVRAVRVVEEAIELAQSLGCCPASRSRPWDVVYAGELGKVEQEIGGTILTLAVLCEARGVSMLELFERELLRVLGKPPEHFAKRNANKLRQGLTGGGDGGAVQRRGLPAEFG